jgi:hypothetical protein
VSRKWDFRADRTSGAPVRLPAPGVSGKSGRGAGGRRWEAGVTSRLSEAVRSALAAHGAAQAHAAAEQALAADPSDLEAIHLRALAEHWALLADFVGLDQAVVLDTESFRLHLELANRLAAAGRSDAAATAVRVAALLDYRLSPHKRATLTGPFNGQVIRQNIFLTLNARLSFGAVFETGSYRGETTEFLAQQVACPVHSCELLTFIYELCRLRLDELRRSGTQRAREVTLDNLDSRAFLRQRLAGPPPESSAGSGPLFFYLDAHCTGDLPIAAECDIILERSPRSVIMIDDFDVPDDPGFHPVDARPGDFVGFSDLVGVLDRFDAGFFPSTSAAETGMRRGCLILTTAPDLSNCLDGMAVLRRVPG